jgi:large subunit ribosomal protein L1
MSIITKKKKFLAEKIDSSKEYSLSESISLIKSLPLAKFIEGVDVAINLGIDAKKPDQCIRGNLVLPHGIGRSKRVAVFAEGDEAEIAKSSGADVVGLESLSNRVKRNEIDFDVLIASPATINVVSKLGQILGPKGLMPSQKSGTLTHDISEAVRLAKAGQIQYRNEKNGIVHSTIGRVNFEEDKLKGNLEFLLRTIKSKKPPQYRGSHFIKKVSISTTMGPSIILSQTEIEQL